jgi:hypothetical protein
LTINQKVLVEYWQLENNIGAIIHEVKEGYGTNTLSGYLIGY